MPDSTPPSRPTDGVPNEITRHPLRTAFQIMGRSISGPLRTRPTQIILISLLGMMAWGFHGELDLLRWPTLAPFLGGVWQGPGSNPAARAVLLPFVPWDQELIAFFAGAILVAAIPILIVKVAWKERISDYGMGLPPPGRRAIGAWSFVIVVVLLIGPFWYGAHSDVQMRSIYPLYRGGLGGAGAFILYELTYFAFFLAIEFMFRGFLLFGLAPHTDGTAREGEAAGALPVRALCIQLLPYVAWHMGKPIVEVWGTPLWGLVCGALAWSSRSIWPILLAHWLLNVWMDAVSLGLI